MDEGLRAEDFRRAWPTALSIAMREVGQLTTQIEGAAAKVESANRDAVLIAELLPQMVQALQEKLNKSGNDLLSTSKTELNLVRDEIFNLLGEIKSVEQRLDSRLNDLEKSATNFSRQRELLRQEEAKQKKRWFNF